MTLAEPASYAHGFSSRSERRDRTRLSRWLSRVDKSSVSRGCRAWLTVLAARSDNTAKSVWGMQTKQAKQIQCTDRQVRRYRVEAEQAGLIITHAGKVERCEAGSFRRRHTNRYQLCIGAVDRKSWSRLPDAGVLYNPSFRRNPSLLSSPFPQPTMPGRLPPLAEQCERCDGGWIWIDEVTTVPCTHEVVAISG